MPKARARRRAAKKRPLAQTRAVMNIVLTRQFGGFILVILAVITLFAQVSPGQSFSDWWRGLFWSTFGWAAPLALLCLLVGGFLLAMTERGFAGLKSHRQPLMGLVLALLALLAILSIVYPQSGKGGGLLGKGIGWPFSPLGDLGGLVLILALGIAAILWGFRVPPRSIAQKTMPVFSGARARFKRSEKPPKELPLASARPPRRPPQPEPGPDGLVPGSTEAWEEEFVPIIKEQPSAAPARGLPEVVSPPLRRSEAGTLEWQLPSVDLLDSTASLEPNEREIRK
ncbi:MAG: hypothetical protein Q7R39_13275, partial [Dehalococcoidia bacterium]|nr:hypothetical protein [Dehalococcoidia bacterium]